MEVLKKVIFLFLILLFITLICTQVEENNNISSQNYNQEQIYEVSRNIPYPFQNFVYLDTVIIGVPKDERSGKRNTVEVLNSASGIALRHRGDKIYAMTAGHWCESDQTQYLLTAIAMNVHIKEYYFKIVKRVSYLGNFYEIEEIFVDEPKDLCVVTFSSEEANKIKNIKPARRQPRIGDDVYTISAPMGFYSHSIRTLFEGYYSGCEPETINCFYTIPGTNGSSGSGVLNKKGELVSILNLSIRGFDNITGGSKLEHIREMYEQYIE